MKKVETLGLVKLSWNLSLALPLAKAHQLQMLLTEALQYDEHGYPAHQTFACTQLYEVPAVDVLSNNLPMFDATMLTSNEVKEWRDAVKAGLDADKEAKAMDIVSPELWIGMRG